jgi:hypothetical protein
MPDRPQGVVGDVAERAAVGADLRRRGVSSSSGTGASCPGRSPEARASLTFALIPAFLSR